jgi:hypothetical protein
MPSTYEKIQSTTLGAPAASVTFSTIPATYTDLVLITNLRYSTGTPSGNDFIRLNSDSATNYSRTFLQGNGSAASSGRGSNEDGMRFLGSTSTANVFTSNITQIQNYSNSTTYKTALNRWSNAGDFALAFVSLWRSTAAVTTIDVLASGTTQFAIGCTFTLYGIKAA